MKASWAPHGHPGAPRWEEADQEAVSLETGAGKGWFPMLVIHKNSTLRWAVVHNWNSSTWETEAGGVQGQPGLLIVPELQRNPVSNNLCVCVCGNRKLFFKTKATFILETEFGSEVNCEL